MLPVSVNDRLFPLEHPIDHDRGNIPVGIVIFLTRPDDVVRHGDDIFNIMRLADIRHQ